MKLQLLSNIKTKIGSTLSSVLSVLGASGSTTTSVCQATCTVAPATTSFLGVSLAFTPLIFISRYQSLIWSVALIFFLLMVILTRARKIYSKIDLGLILINGGLLTISFPYFKDLGLEIFLFWLGGGITLTGLALLILSTRRLVFSRLRKI